MDPTIPTTPTPTPAPTPEPKPEAIPAPLMGMDSAFEKPEPQPTAPYRGCITPRWPTREALSRVRQITERTDEIYILER